MRRRDGFFRTGVPDGLVDLLRDRFGIENPEPVPIDVKCAWPVFRVSGTDGKPMFVKLASSDAAAKTLSFLKSVAGCPLFPVPIAIEPVGFGGFSVLCLEWKDTVQVNAEDMSDAQLDSFLDGCGRMSEALRRYEGAVEVSGEDDPDLQYGRVANYASRHPLLGRLLVPLLSVPAVERSYAGRDLVTIHGDFQPRNYGFTGGRFAAVFDFDALTKGLACEDAAYAFTERARRSELSVRARRRLTTLFLECARKSEWAREDWLVAVNHARLRIAARRLDRHPDASFIAWDIARRDRLLAVLADALRTLNA